MTGVTTGQGNEENMARIRALMEQSQQVNMGSANTKDVLIDFTTEFGTHYHGTVVFKRPNMQDYMRIGALKAQYIGQNGSVDLNLVDVQIKLIAHVMSTLKVVVAKAPAWMVVQGRISVEHFQEVDILYHLYAKYEEWENSFRTRVSEELPGDSPTAAGAEDVGTSEVLRGEQWSATTHGPAHPGDDAVSD